MENKLYVSSSPHITDNESIPKIMYSVLLSLIPATAGSIYFFGIRAGWVIVFAVIAAVATEAILQKLLHKPLTITDGSAIVTGVLLAFNLPAEVPWWIPVIGSVFAIAIGKIPFGGLGYNPMNPALLGRAFLLASWPTRMTVFQTSPKGGSLSGINFDNIDVLTEATPLNVFKQASSNIHDITAKIETLKNTISESAASLSVDRLSDLNSQIAQNEELIVKFRSIVNNLYDSYGNLFFGNIGGCLGETSVLLLLIGAVYLIYKRYIGFKIPVTYIGTVAILSWIFGGIDGYFTGDPLFHVLSGGLILGAFFMATDMVTSPVTVKGRIIFGCGCGVLTVIIRLVGGYPEGVSYSILLMNLMVPLINRYTKPKVFGEVKQK